MSVPNTKGKFCTNVQDMEIGDYIACKYTASSGVAGEFSDLGAALSVAQTNEIPVVSSATPNGYFYFIKADTGILIADRNVQHSVSWATLNAKGYIDGFIKEERIMPISAIASTTEGNYNVEQTYDNYIGDKNIAGWWSKSSIPILNQTLTYNIKLSTITTLKIENGYPGYGIKNVLIQYSKNGIDFIDYTNIIVPDNAAISLPMNVMARAIRIVIKDGYYGTQDYCTIAEVYINHDALGGLIRSLDGGVSYIDTNGNSSLTHTNLGAFPANNEWDKYIEKSNLNGKIIAGDENVWNHKSEIWSLAKNHTISGLKSKDGSNVATSSHFVVRNKNNFGMALGNAWNTLVFRPVLQLLHPKQTNFYY